MRWTPSSSWMAWKSASAPRTILKKLKAQLTGRSIGLLGPNGAGKSTLHQYAARLSQALLRHRPHLRPRHPHPRPRRSAA